mgnify:FL=1
MKKVAEKVRVRIAPSPTGYMHIGLARTALFNYLFAKRHGGVFVLRIEDTDVERSTKEFDADILDALSWLGMVWDEGPMKDGSLKGEYGPYRQSERTDMYEKYIRQLLDESKAYRCFCTKEELEAQRAYFSSQGLPPKYAGTCASLSTDETAERVAKGVPSVIRFRTPAKTVKFHDLIRGDVSFDTGLFGDMVIAKDERTPLYNFAVVVDDALMHISHIIRGEDHLSNTPKQILMYETLGFSVPVYAHIPLILGVDRSKLSKRHGAQAVTEYRREGYLPEAIVNFMALLGWNPGTEQELFSLDELCHIFDIERVSPSGAAFSVQKLEWFNAQYLKRLSVTELAQRCEPYLIVAGLVPAHGADMAFLENVIALERERIKKMSDIVELADFFFRSPSYKPELLIWKKSTKKEVAEVLALVADALAAIPTDAFTAAHATDACAPLAERFGNGTVYWPLRVALSGKEFSPGPLEIAQVLGKEKTLARVAEARAQLGI